jgi:hypothetical protein
MCLPDAQRSQPGNQEADCTRVASNLLRDREKRDPSELFPSVYQVTPALEYITNIFSFLETRMNMAHLSNLVDMRQL